MMSKCSVAFVLIVSMFAVISCSLVGDFIQIECGEFNYIYDEKPTADEDRWPWLAALFIKDENRFICGGSLITTSHILTAAHCLQPKNANQPMDLDNLIVYLGKHNLSAENEVGAIAVNASTLYIHEDWNAMDKISYDADIAIIQLGREVERQRHIYPVCLWTSYHISFRNNNGAVAGWGDSTNFNGFTEISREIDIKIVENCSKNKNLKEIISDRTFCARGEAKSPCKGDGGSGLYKTLDSKRYIQGIVSVGLIKYNFACDGDHPTVFTKVESFAGWILEIIGSDRFLKCKFVAFQSFWCVAEFLTIKSEDYHIAGIIGQLNTNVSSNFVQKFIIEQQKTTFLPVNLWQVFPNLKLYKIKDSNLSAIRNCDFSGLNILTHLSVSNNRLNEIAEDTFHDLIELTDLNLENNNIKSLHNDIFTKNVQLKFVKLSNNRIEILDSSLFRFNINVHSIAFDSNKLDVIQSNFTAPMTHLTHADFRNNTCMSAYVSSSQIKGETLAPINLTALSKDFLDLCEFNSSSTQILKFEQPNLESTLIRS